MPEALNLLKIVEQLQQDFRNVVNETKKKYVPIKDNADAQLKLFKGLVNSNQDLRSYFLQKNVEIVNPFIEGCYTKQPKLITVCLTALQRLITNQLLTETSVENLLKAICSLVDAELEELKLLQTTILLVTTGPVLSDASLSQALGICLRLHNSRNSAVVNTAAAAIRQCTGAVFDQACKDVPPSSSDSVSSNDKTSAFKFTPASKSAFFLFQDLCLLTSGSVPHWFQGIESISPLLGLELIESVLLNYCDLFIREKEFLHLLKERVCPLVTKLLAPDAQTGGSRDPGDGPGVAASSAPSVFGIHVRLNRIVVLLCSKYFACLNAECGVLLSTVMRTVDTETAMWRLALALEVMFKVISLPDLLVNICATFDLANPQSRVFRGLVTTASGFVQSTLLASHVPNRDSVGAPSGMSAGHQPSQKPALIYRGGNFVIADVQKFAILELLDRLEPPCLPEGYSLRLAISCLLQFVWSLQHVIQRVKSSDKPQTEHKMLKLSWTGLLPALSLLLEACADEKLTDSFLLAESVMVVLSSLCGLGDSREAFVASICKSALPSLSVLSERLSPKHRQPPQVCDEATDRSPVVIVVNANHGPGNLSLEVSSSSSSGGSSVDVPPGTNGSQAPSSLFITAKHIQISKSLLELAKTNGSLLESSWFPVLTTMQQLVWMLGLRAAPSATGSSMSNAQNAPTPMSLDTSFFENASAPNIATQGGGVVSKVISELPTLSQTLSFVFEQSKNFDEIALGYLIRALCSVASETLEISTTNREPSHFSVVKLTEVGLANLHRISVWWKTITDQLLMMCKTTHTELRKLVADALMLLIKQVITATKPTSLFWNNVDLTQLVLDPLTQLTEIKFNDVQEKQLQCVQYLIHCYGDEISESWLRLINIIGSISQSQSDHHIRSAFQCFQLVVTDYLSTLCPDCYPACVNTAAKFGHQMHDLNIALAAIGSLLHLTDFLFQRERSTEEEKKIIEPLWVEVFCHLSALVRDRRPAVRKSAGQTLFNAIECHSGQFVQTTWAELLWTVFFPLLADVQDHCANAPVERGSKTGNLLVHHSRDTAAKQWAETVVLTLTGVARCFVSKQPQLVTLNRFSEAWEKLLSNAERAVLTPNSEIAQNALSTLKILLDFDTSQCENAMATTTWLAFWRTWTSIGRRFVDFIVSNSSQGERKISETTQAPVVGLRKPAVYSFDANFFALFFDLFPALFPRIQQNFNGAFFAEFSDIISQGVLGPLFSTEASPIVGVGGSALSAPSFMSPFAATSIDEQGLTPTQRAVFKCLSVVAEVIQSKDVSVQHLLVPFLELLLHLSLYAVRIPKPGSSTDQITAVPLNYIIFAEKCLELATTLYLDFVSSDLLLNADGLLKMIEALHVPLAAKYRCQCQSTWLLASKCFFEVITAGVPIATKQKSPSAKTPKGDLWDNIYATIRDFLFCQNQPTEPLSGDEFQQHEALDCKFIRLICDRFLSRPDGLPQKFIEQLVGVLGLGSIQASIGNADLTLLDVNSLKLNSNFPPPSGLHPFVHRPSFTCTGDAAIATSNDLDLQPFVSRENFMRLCFESLLSFAFFQGNAVPSTTSASPWLSLKSSASAPKPHVVLCRTAIRDVLDRCRFILQRFTKSAKLTGKCPLPRAKLSEVNFAFQALTLLLTNFTAPLPNSAVTVDSGTWSSVIDMYPLVVDCVFVADSSQLLTAVHKLLHLYGRLLQPKVTAPPTPLNASS